MVRVDLPFGSTVAETALCRARGCVEAPPARDTLRSSLRCDVPVLPLIPSRQNMNGILHGSSVSRCRPLLAIAVAVGVGLAAAPTLAHHSRAMFDVGKNVTYRGVVKEYRWQNPHSHIVITVGAGASDPSTVGTWTVEASAIDVMTRRGWTATTYKPGDPITVVAHPNRDSSNPVLLFYAIKADGTRLYRANNRYPGEEE